MTTRPESEIDWSLTTWKGSRLQQHRAFQQLSFARKLELIEEMSKTVDFFSESHNDQRPGSQAIDDPAR